MFHIDPRRRELLDEIERLRAEHTFVERMVAGQLLSRMTELEAELAAERAEIKRLRAASNALAEVALIAVIHCKDHEVEQCNRAYAAWLLGGPS
jgi:hypothetical protein